MPLSSFESLQAQFSEMPVFLASACGALPREMLLAQPRIDVSPLAEQAWHLCDCETDLYAQRIDAMLERDNPVLAPVFVKEWIVARGYFSRPVSEAIIGFAAARSRFVRRLVALTPEELARRGTRADGKPYTVAGVIQEMAAHDREHRQRITAVLVDFATYGVPTPDAAALRY